MWKAREAFTTPGALHVTLGPATALSLLLARVYVRWVFRSGRKVF